MHSDMHSEMFSKLLYNVYDNYMKFFNTDLAVAAPATKADACDVAVCCHRMLLLTNVFKH